MSHVTIYQHRNYAGAAQQLNPGRYDMNQLRLANDTISSLRIPNGWTAILYEHAGFQGRSKLFHCDTAYVGDDFNGLDICIDQGR